jgi:hypothetical protein
LPFKIEETPDRDKLVGTMDSMLEQILLSVLKDGFAQTYWKGKRKHISSAQVSFSSPWFVSKIKNIDIQKEKLFLINQNFIDSVLDSEKKIFVDEFSDGRSAKDSSSEMVVIENIFTDFKINGYPIKNYIGQKTKSFGTSLYISAIPKFVADTVTSQLSKHFSLKSENISMNSFPLVLFAVTKNVFPDFNDFLLVNVTAEVTDIVLVSQKFVAEVVSFPSGHNLIIRQIGQKFGVSAQIAESILVVYKNKKSDEETTARMEKIISDVKKEWSVYFDDAFSEISKNNLLPQTICLAADQDVADLYYDFLKNDDGEPTEAQKNSQIFNLDTEKMSGFYETNQKFIPDTFLSILTIFSNLN